MKTFAASWQVYLEVVVAISIACCSGCSRTSMGPVPSVCLRPTGAVKDARQAILRARVGWYCARPVWHTPSESEWLANYIASTRDQVWSVSANIPSGFVGGGPVVEIAAGDGRILDMYQTQ